MLKKKSRLPYFIRFPSKLSYSSPTFTCKLMENTLLYNRYGVIISKKNVKSAVKRNRVKRQIRACIQSLSLEVKSGYDFLFIIKKLPDEKRQNLCYEMRGMYKTMGLL